MAHTQADYFAFLFCVLVKENGKITNKDYQEIKDTSDRIALRDLENLMELNILEKDGEKKATSYKLRFGG